jgi:uncharacterized protein (DUF1697 family)
MPRRIVLLRGINVGPHNRIAMPKLREALEGAGFGFEDVRTYLQSGNVLLASSGSSSRLAARCKRLIADGFGLDIDVIVRTRSELAKIVDRNPLADVAKEPKRYQVTFLERQLPSGTLDRLAGLAAESERFVAQGRELYAWHPAGVARSKLWAGIASSKLGVAATSRNWATVTALLELADG